MILNPDGFIQSSCCWELQENILAVINTIAQINEDRKTVLDFIVVFLWFS